MEDRIAPCGINCLYCDFHKDSKCEGCRIIDGKPFWTELFNCDVCGLYDCAVNIKNYKSCADCDDVPCQTWLELKEPEITEEEHKEHIKMRLKNLGIK